MQAEASTLLPDADAAAGADDLFTEVGTNGAAAAAATDSDDDMPPPPQGEESAVGPSPAVHRRRRLAGTTAAQHGNGGGGAGIKLAAVALQGGRGCRHRWPANSDPSRHFTPQGRAVATLSTPEALVRLLPEPAAISHEIYIQGLLTCANSLL